MKILLVVVALSLVAKGNTFLVASNGVPGDAHQQTESFHRFHRGGGIPWRRTAFTDRKFKVSSSKEDIRENIDTRASLSTSEVEIELPAAAVNDEASASKPGFFRRMYNKLFRRHQEAKAQLQSDAEELRASAEKLRQQAEIDLNNLGERIDLALKEQSDRLINDIAVDFCRLITKDSWEVFTSVANITDVMSTKSTMDGTIAQLSNVLIDLGVGKDGEQKAMENTLKSYRFQWRQSYNTADGYPINSEHTILLGNQVVIEFYGKIQFDLMKRQILFQMDELKVLDVVVDLDQVMENATNTTAS